MQEFWTSQQLKAKHPSVHTDQLDLANEVILSDHIQLVSLEALLSPQRVWFGDPVHLAAGATDCICRFRYVEGCEASVDGQLTEATGQIEEYVRDFPPHGEATVTLYR